MEAQLDVPKSEELLPQAATSRDPRDEESSKAERSEDVLAQPPPPPTTDDDDTAAYVNMDSSNHSIPRFVIRATAIASLGGILFGYDMGVVSGALPQLANAFELTRGQQETVVSVLYLGGGFGAAVGGSVCDLIGRKRTILIVDVLFVLGAAILFWSTRVNHLILGRIVVGVAVSVSGIADVSYLHEIAPKEWRGSIVSVNEACISLGFLFAYIAGYGISVMDDQNGWRAMFGLSGFVAIIQFLGMLYMPESPVWLQDKGRSEECRKSLSVIYGGMVPQGSFDIETERKQQSSSANEKSVSSPTIPIVGEEAVFRRSRSYDSITRTGREGGRIDKEAESNPIGSFLRDVGQCCQQARHIFQRYHRQVAIALMLSVTQQLCGQTPVLNYAPLIFASVGLASKHSTLGSTLLIGLVKFVVTVLVIWKIEYLGRRFLLLSGMAVISLGLLLLTIAFGTGMHETDNEEVGSGVYFALPGVLLVVLGYSASFGPLTWLLTSELFPTDIRGRALGVSTIVTYLCASFVTYTFLSSQSWLGAGVVFATYGLITVAGILFAFLAIPDTGDKTVEEIEVDLRNMWWWRRRTSGSWKKGLPVAFAELA